MSLNFICWTFKLIHSGGYEGGICFRRTENFATNLGYSYSLEVLWLIALRFTCEGRGGLLMKGIFLAFSCFQDMDLRLL